MAAETGAVSSRLALGWLIAGEWRWHPTRFIATAAAIAIGVALGFAVHLVNGSALSAFDGAVRSVNGAADLQVRAASPLGFDELLYPRVATAPGVADASPVVRLDARVGEAWFTLLGLDVIRAAVVTPSLVGMRPQGPHSGNDAVFDGDALFLSRAALDAADARVGEVIEVTANGRSAPLRVTGVLAGVDEGQAIGVIDIAAAQWRFDRLGRLDRLDLKLDDRAVAEAALARLLPGDATIASEETRETQISALSRAYRVNLDMLALVALLTGGFLVYSAQSLAVARRSRAFALVRTLGLPRGGIVASVALEGAMIGVIGSAAGLALGYVLASAALRWFGGDLGAGYFRGEAMGVALQPVAGAGFFALGVSAALLGSFLPARAASRVAPAAALKNEGDPVDPRAPMPWKPAAALLATGAIAAFAPPVAGLPLLGFASIALLLAGGIAGVPWLARRLLSGWAERPIASVPRLLAVRHIHGAPGEAATALCGIVASTALMIAMATMVTSFRGAVDDWLDQVLAADLYMRAEGAADFDATTQARLARTPGLARIDFGRQIALMLAPDRPPVMLVARPIEPGRRDALLGPIDRADRLPRQAVPVWVSEPASRLYGWTLGDTIDLPIGRGERFAVMGVWRDYARQQGAIVMRDTDYTRLTGDATREEAAILLAPDADPDRVGRALVARLPEGLQSSVSLARPAALRRLALDLFDRSFVVTYLLEAVAILVGLAGVAATMSARTIARAREFGMLRHLGVSRRRIATMLGIEGALLGAIGAVAGVLLGGVLSQVLIHVINPQSFNWTMGTLVPWGTVAGVVAALVIASAGTAMLAGRRATAQGPLMAVRQDW